MLYSPLLPVHIAGGIAGIVSGTAAMVFRKGSPRHILAGKVFVVSMLAMSGTGSFLAVLKSDFGTLMGGSITFYLVLTGWLTARRDDGQLKALDWPLLALIIAATAAAFTWGIQAVQSPAGLKNGIPPPPYFIFGTLALLAAVGDVRMLLRHGIAGSQRLARHLWRMSVALFIAAFSFFPGQVKLFPASVRAIKVLYVPHLLLLAVLCYWLFRVRLRRSGARSQPAAVGTTG